MSSKLNDWQTYCAKRIWYRSTYYKNITFKQIEDFWIAKRFLSIYKKQLINRFVEILLSKDF